MSIYLHCPFWFSFSAISLHGFISILILILIFWLNISFTNLLFHIAYLVHFIKFEYSASVVDKTIFFQVIDFNDIGLFPNIKIYLEVDLLLISSPVKSASQ